MPATEEMRSIFEGRLSNSVRRQPTTVHEFLFILWVSHNNPIYKVYIAAVRLFCFFSAFFVEAYPGKAEFSGLVGTVANEVYPRKAEMSGSVGTLAEGVYPRKAKKSASVGTLANEAYPRKVELSGPVGTLLEGVYPRKTEMSESVGTLANEVYPRKTEMSGLVGTAANKRENMKEESKWKSSRV